MAKITVEVLDGTFGQLAEAMRMRLDRADGRGWRPIASTQTSAEGRVDDWACPPLSCGLYRIALNSDSYLVALGVAAAYQEIQVIVRVRDHDLCHVQVALSPYFYTVAVRAHPGAADPVSLRNSPSARPGRRAAPE